jgi:DNA-binding transcriptional ArsR family regulator
MSVAIDELFAALAEPTRRRIMEELKDEALAVGMLVERLQISQPTVSKHLKVLREASLVSMTAQGQRRIYSLDLPAIETLGQWCADFLPEPQPAEATVAQLTEVTAATAAVMPANAGTPATTAAQQLGRTGGRSLEHVTGRAHELIERFPRFGRKR